MWVFFAWKDKFWPLKTLRGDCFELWKQSHGTDSKVNYLTWQTWFNSLKSLQEFKDRPSFNKIYDSLTYDNYIGLHSGVLQPFMTEEEYARMLNTAVSEQQYQEVCDIHGWDKLFYWNRVNIFPSNFHFREIFDFSLILYQFWLNFKRNCVFILLSLNQNLQILSNPNL